MSFLFAAMMVILVVAAIADLYGVSGRTGNLFTQAFVGFLLLGLILRFLLTKMTCPVCGYTFVGRDDVELFTHTCRNCGRRSGDFG
jgi:hypothetical protein